MDPDVFAIVFSAPDAEALSKCFVIDQRGTETTGVPATLPSIPQDAIAVVDRTADVAQAAQVICATHFLFKGHSTCVPRIILVNEWILGAFVDACMLALGSSSGSKQHATKLVPFAGKNPSEVSLDREINGFRIMCNMPEYVISFGELPAKLQN